MRFKNWLIENGATTSLMHGGLYGLPFRNTNANMPGIRSKWATKESPQGDDPEVDPERVFGFRGSQDKKRSKERNAKSIDRQRVVPIRNDRPDIIY